MLRLCKCCGNYDYERKSTKRETCLQKANFTVCYIPHVRDSVHRPLEGDLSRRRRRLSLTLKTSESLISFSSISFVLLFNFTQDRSRFFLDLLSLLVRFIFRFLCFRLSFRRNDLNHLRCNLDICVGRRPSPSLSNHLLTPPRLRPGDPFPHFLSFFLRRIYVRRDIICRPLENYLSSCLRQLSRKSLSDPYLPYFYLP